MIFTTRPFFKKNKQILKLAGAPTPDQRKIGKRVLPILVTELPVEFTGEPPLRGRKSRKSLFKRFSFRKRTAADAKDAAQCPHASAASRAPTPATSHKPPATSKDAPRHSTPARAPPESAHVALAPQWAASQIVGGLDGGSEETLTKAHRLGGSDQAALLEENAQATCAPRRARFLIHWDGLLLGCSDAVFGAHSEVQDGAADAGPVMVQSCVAVLNPEPVSVHPGVESTARSGQVSTSSTVPVYAALGAQSNSPGQGPQCSGPQKEQPQQTQQKTQKTQERQETQLPNDAPNVLAVHAAQTKTPAASGPAAGASPSFPGPLANCAVSLEFAPARARPPLFFAPARARQSLFFAPARWAYRLGARAAHFSTAVREDWAFRRQERRTTREVKKQQRKLCRLEAERLLSALVSRARAAAFEYVHADLDQLQQRRTQAGYALHAQRRVRAAYAAAQEKREKEKKETEEKEKEKEKAKAKAPKRVRILSPLPKAKVTAPPVAAGKGLSPRPSNSSLSPRALRSTAASSVACHHCHVCGRKR